jgi:hypothetical protein
MLQPLIRGVVLTRFYHLLNRNRGATASERSRPLPGDQLVPNASSVTTMAISIDAPLEDVWPWLVRRDLE